MEPDILKILFINQDSNLTHLLLKENHSHSISTVSVQEHFFLKLELCSVALWVSAPHKLVYAAETDPKDEGSILSY